MPSWGVPFIPLLLAILLYICPELLSALGAFWFIPALSFAYVVEHLHRHPVWVLPLPSWDSLSLSSVVVLSDLVLFNDEPLLGSHLLKSIKHELVLLYLLYLGEFFPNIDWRISLFKKVSQLVLTLILERYFLPLLLSLLTWMAYAQFPLEWLCFLNLTQFNLKFPYLILL